MNKYRYEQIDRQTLVDSMSFKPSCYNGNSNSSHEILRDLKAILLETNKNDSMRNIPRIGNYTICSAFFACVLKEQN